MVAEIRCCKVCKEVFYREAWRDPGCEIRVVGMNECEHCENAQWQHGDNVLRDLEVAGAKKRSEGE